MVVFDLDSRRINQWLSAFAMLCRVLALLYALVLVNFHPHPVVQAYEATIMIVWWATAAYTALLGVLLFTRAEVLRPRSFSWAMHSCASAFSLWPTAATATSFRSIHSRRC
ncbi:MAG: hypothetical protein HZY76_09840 [Anaerolineae bacterium]|nr:MAG: hypothetical protein HZY76_09840 [Anaerolineae bacterium]